MDMATNAVLLRRGSEIKQAAAIVVSKVPNTTVNFLPILLNVRYYDEGKNHLVGGKIGKDGTLYLYDSLKEDMIDLQNCIKHSQ